MKLNLIQINQLYQELKALLLEEINFMTKYEIMKAIEVIKPINDTVQSLQKEAFKDFSNYSLVKDIPEDKRADYDKLLKEHSGLLETKQEVVPIDNLTFKMFEAVDSTVPYEIIFKILRHDED